MLPRLPISMIIRDARLLFLYALGSKAKCEEVIGPDNFSCRLARRGDIGAIRDCNLKTLPENYTPDFYDNHIKDWPELALVAEYVERQNDDEQPKVVGYVLGRMEDSKETSSIPPVFRDPTSRVPPTPPSSTGHVTSLAVLPGFRRHGVASRLMSSLHAQMDTCYNAKTVSLHVRKSNRGAIRLYEELLGYKVAGVASSYYSDGEDAFLMQAHLPVNDAVHATQPVGERTGPLVPSAPAGVALPPLQSDTMAATAATAAAAAGSPTSSATVLQAVAGAGGAGGGGGFDRAGAKGVPSRRMFSQMGALPPRRPGAGCGGSSGRCGGGGWASRGGDLTSFL